MERKRDGDCYNENSHCLGKINETIGTQREIEKELNVFDEALKQLEVNVGKLADRLSPLINNSKDNVEGAETLDEVICELANQIKIKRRTVEIINFRISNLLKTIEL